ncbi:alanyl-tRNA synthetase/misacylated tRNA(Ala) deacylase|uniref:Ala-tRNA(Pro) hydrolase n=1 Tax=Brenneria salicis ATCC 15712 = DSM 30166 TaxID=714314 RepID=A0A366HWS1_9GAMM|nr:alanine--tRNA ligase-related protein [Brenneria salicis]NMN90400.1 alanyl-tRNA synthetase/misacylated tRNA(Ala) deacylase [Brenneria salicis ATCC 15712 = DSM 30166]RBP57851.1 Ala-tRNA(Pro) hydrolase [Brenneria salicis ATCC 15712 = DSM 30166]RLM28910.1 hypothetical protein BHG07_16395 [Brenneria salicis ATCC 15712 = DSM 30166]
MLTTARLFDDTPYNSTFEANVIYVGEDFIILDKTLFYPLSGNQNHDTGKINGIPVTYVSVENENEEKEELSFTAPIKHFVDTSNFEKGQSVKGEINKEDRLKIMKLHAASHIVEHFLQQMSGFLSVEGSFVNADKDRTDYKMSENITPERLASLETQVNDFISSGKEITFTKEGDLRYWHCDNIDMLCCGTHVANTPPVRIDGTPY